MNRHIAVIQWAVDKGANFDTDATANFIADRLADKTDDLLDVGPTYHFKDVTVYDSLEDLLMDIADGNDMFALEDSETLRHFTTETP